jgi:hypothetical protein
MRVLRNMAKTILSESQLPVMQMYIRDTQSKIPYLWYALVRISPKKVQDHKTLKEFQLR